MAEYQVIFWRDIPGQVRGRSDRIRFAHSLSGRFQETIHRAAFRSRAITGYAYICDWQPGNWHKREGRVHDVVLSVAAELEAAYTDERLNQLAIDKGYDSMVIKHQIIYWRDIPAQLKLKAGSQRLSIPLPDRFAVAIDEAAMRAGKTSADEYLSEWRKGEWQECTGNPEKIAADLIAELNATYPPERLRLLIRQHGLEEEQD